MHAIDGLIFGIVFIPARDLDIERLDLAPFVDLWSEFPRQSPIKVADLLPIEPYGDRVLVVPVSLLPGKLKLDTATACRIPDDTLAALSALATLRVRKCDAHNLRSEFMSHEEKVPTLGKIRESYKTFRRRRSALQGRSTPGALARALMRRTRPLNPPEKLCVQQDNVKPRI